MTNERCAEILQSIKFMLSSEKYSDEEEEALDKAIKAMGQSKPKMFKVPDGQNPYHVIGEYIRSHITVIEDIIAVIEIDGSITNTLFMVDMDEDGYFIWNTDWYEGEKNVVLIDFFPVSEATKPSTQPEQKKGEWIAIKNRKGTTVALRCSSCGNSPKKGILSDFCPNCGADMKGKQDGCNS